MQKVQNSLRVHKIEQKWSMPIEKILYRWHWEQDLMHKQIGKKLNVPRPTITRWFKLLGVPSQPCHRITNLNLLNTGSRKGPRAKPKIKQPPKWHVNTNFFKKWSSEMAYVLGFFAADGSMVINPRGAHYLDFHITDKDLLFEIRKTLDSNHKIKERERGGNRKNIYRLQIGSKKMFNDLINLGLTPRKTKTLQLPKVPQKYFPDFVRGYFDGDGTVAICTYKRKNRNNKKYTVLQSGFTSGSEIFLKQLQEKLKRIANLSGCLTFLAGVCRLKYCINDSMKLYNFMYYSDDIKFFLERKQKIFQKYINGPVV